MLYGDPQSFRARRNAAAIRSWVDCQIACAATGSHSINRIVCELRSSVDPCFVRAWKEIVAQLSNRSKRRGEINGFLPDRRRQEPHFNMAPGLDSSGMCLQWVQSGTSPAPSCTCQLVNVSQFPRRVKSACGSFCPLSCLQTLLAECCSSQRVPQVLQDHVWLACCGEKSSIALLKASGSKATYILPLILRPLTCEG